MRSLGSSPIDSAERTSSPSHSNSLICDSARLKKRNHSLSCTHAHSLVLLYRGCRPTSTRATPRVASNATLPGQVRSGAVGLQRVGTDAAIIAVIAATLVAAAGAVGVGCIKSKLELWHGRAVGWRTVPGGSVGILYTGTHITISICLSESGEFSVEVQWGWLPARSTSQAAHSPVHGLSSDLILPG